MFLRPGLYQWSSQTIKGAGSLVETCHALDYIHRIEHILRTTFNDVAISVVARYCSAGPTGSERLRSGRDIVWLCGAVLMGWDDEDVAGTRVKGILLKLGPCHNAAFIGQYRVVCQCQLFRLVPNAAIEGLGIANDSSFHPALCPVQSKYRDELAPKQVYSMETAKVCANKTETRPPPF